MNKYEEVLKRILPEINPTKQETASINSFLKDFNSSLKKELANKKLDAQVFVGGSFAKGTMIKKGRYDIDVFIRFSEEYRGKNISDLTEKMLKRFVKKGLSRVHGSRDYFRVEADSSFFLEVIPVIKVKNPKQAENITDLSYFHVAYTKKKLKTEKIVQDIRIAKAFCHANNCYGAESYINGFSGYALELLIYHYKGFVNFLKASQKIKEQEIIDIEKLYKNKNEVLMNMNSAKMTSPIVLIDPTYKERNALAALSKETFEMFNKAGARFLNDFSVEYFKERKEDVEKIKREAEKKNFNFVEISLSTDKQDGDIAGTKLLKFFNYLTLQLSKLYDIKKKGFDYNGKQEASCFFVVNPKKEIEFTGPSVDDKKNCEAFKKRHKKTFVKNKKLYATESFNKKLKVYLKEWKSINSQKIIEMHINNFEIKD